MHCAPVELSHTFSLSTADQQRNAVTRDIADTTNIDNHIPQFPQTGEPHFHILTYSRHFV